MAYIYVLVLNNGEEYHEDHNDWNAGVFANLSEAVEHGMKDCLHDAKYFIIEKWDMELNIHEQDFRYELRDFKWFYLQEVKGR